MDEYVISIKIKTDKRIMLKDLPEIIKEEINHGAVEILTAETYESWKEEQAAR